MVVDQNSPAPSPSQPASETDEVEQLRAQLADAQHIARWLYDRSPGLRRMLGDVGEWRWLDASKPADEAPRPLVDADRDMAVLRSYADVQAVGDDPYDADVTDLLGLSPREFDASVSRLIHRGLVTGGQLTSRSFVETVTDAGMKAAGMPPRESTPPAGTNVPPE